MIPEDAREHSPQLLLDLLSRPPANHGERLEGATAEAYRFLVSHKYITQTKSSSKRNFGKRVAVSISFDHKVERSAEELREYLSELVVVNVDNE
jgi:hypothetical protein